MRVTERLYSANKKTVKTTKEEGTGEDFRERFRPKDLDETNHKILNLRTEKPLDNSILDPN